MATTPDKDAALGCRYARRDVTGTGGKQQELGTTHGGSYSAWRKATDILLEVLACFALLCVKRNANSSNSLKQRSSNLSVGLLVSSKRPFLGEFALLLHRKGFITKY